LSSEEHGKWLKESFTLDIHHVDAADKSIVTCQQRTLHQMF